MPTIRAWMASLLGSALFFPEPTPQTRMTAEKRLAFEAAFHAMLETPAHEPLDYTCPYPKWEFLRYLVRERALVLHGSNRDDITLLEPRTQTDFSGKPITAVFASRDALWPMFFAVVRMADYRGSLRNGCWVVNTGSEERRFYFFSLNRDLLGPAIWTAGTIYILPGETFQMTDAKPVRFDEWVSLSAVSPIARLTVTPDDFPLLNRVAGHREGESMIVSWLSYKRRCHKR